MDKNLRIHAPGLHHTIPELYDTVGTGYRTGQEILTENLDKHRVALSRLLSPDQKQPPC